MKSGYTCSCEPSFGASDETLWLRLRLRQLQRLPLTITHRIGGDMQLC